MKPLDPNDPCDALTIMLNQMLAENQAMLRTVIARGKNARRANDEMSATFWKRVFG